MKRTILVSSILLLIHVPCFSLPGQSPDAQATKKSCGNFVQSFYDWYVKKPDWPRALKDRPSAFGPELFRGLKEDSDAQAKSPHDIVGLDWDPLLNSQDPGEHYAVGLVKLKGGGTCWAELHEDWSGKKSEEALLAAELVNDLGQWHFVNFYYRFPQSDLAASVSRGGLLTILKHLRDAREKSAKSPVANPTPQPNNRVPAGPAAVSKPTPRKLVGVGVLRRNDGSPGLHCW